MSKHIEVVPNILLNKKTTNNKVNNPKPSDPDVDFILNDGDNLDIMNLKHKPTNEEKEKKEKEQKYSWLIIGLAVLVIILLIAIVWYVLKDNIIKEEPKKIPDGILQPGVHPSYNFKHPMHPINRPQMENLPINANFMNRSNNVNQQPSKEDLLSTLNKLKPIPEESSIEEIKEDTSKKLKPSKKQDKKQDKKNTDERVNTKIIENQEQENDGVDDDDEADNELAKKFYDKLQQNIDNDEADDADENKNY